MPEKPLPSSNQLSSYQLQGEAAPSSNCPKRTPVEDVTGVDDVEIVVVVVLLDVLVASSGVLVASLCVLVAMLWVLVALSGVLVVTLGVLVVSSKVLVEIFSVLVASVVDVDAGVDVTVDVAAESESVLIAFGDVAETPPPEKT
jgi:hypothetical protein